MPLISSWSMMPACHMSGHVEESETAKQNAATELDATSTVKVEPFVSHFDYYISMSCEKNVN